MNDGSVELHADHGGHMLNSYAKLNNNLRLRNYDTLDPGDLIYDGDICYDTFDRVTCFKKKMATYHGNNLSRAEQPLAKKAVPEALR